MTNQMYKSVWCIKSKDFLMLCCTAIQNCLRIKFCINFKINFCIVVCIKSFGIIECHWGELTDWVKYFKSAVGEHVVKCSKQGVPKTLLKTRRLIGMSRKKKCPQCYCYFARHYKLSWAELWVQLFVMVFSRTIGLACDTSLSKQGKGF